MIELNRWFVLIGAVLFSTSTRSHAYVDLPPTTLGRLCGSSMHISEVRVDKVDAKRGRVIYRAVRDLKGNAPSDYWKQAVDPRTKAGESLLKWAQPGKTALFFGSAARNAGYVYVEGNWYLFAAPEGATQWWHLVRADPTVLRAYAGDGKELFKAVEDCLKGKDVLVPVRVQADTEAGQKSRLALLRASFKRVDYDFKRDFVRWLNDAGPGAGLEPK